ncbi:MAG: hypothetical protein ACQER4_02910 [Bacteroidota bacterium]
MLLIYLLSILATIGLFWVGSSGTVKLHSIRGFRLIQTALLLTVLLTGLQIAFRSGWIPHSVPAGAMSLLYGSTAGLLFGMSIRLFRLKQRSGQLYYTPRSFWSDHGLDAAALLLILFGLYRTTLFQELPVTPIRLFSGLSLTGLGLYSWTLRPVPEIRSRGILFLDRFIPVKQLLSSRWTEETTLTIDCRNHEEDIESIYLQVPDEFERRDADQKILILLQQAEDIREKERKEGTSA